MPKNIFLRFLVVAATVTAVAAISTFFIIWSTPYPGGWGVPVAQFSEVWSQRVLPGIYRSTFVVDQWLLTEGALAASDHVRYDARPRGTMHVCLPFAIFSTFVGLASTAIHLSVCWCVVRMRKRGESALALAFRSALRAAWVPLFTCLIYWVWAGADRGSVTQRVVGETFTVIAFWPWARAAVLLGGILMVLAVVLRTSGTPWEVTDERQTPTRPARRSRGALSAFVASVLLLTLPYWGILAMRAFGENAPFHFGQWSRTTAMHDLLDRIAPVP